MSAPVSPVSTIVPTDARRARENSAAMGLGGYRLRISAIILAALVVQGILLRAGVERLSADESARSLMAHGLSWTNALEPFIWPPFTKLLVGLALKLHDDVFVVPRILSGLAGLGVMLAVAHLAGLLFRDRRVQLLRSEEHTSELQSRQYLVCRLLLEKKKKNKI